MLITHLNYLFQREASEYDAQMLNISGEILSVNPDFYTLWNIRKETITILKEEM